jgi:hypothetical protein
MIRVTLSTTQAQTLLDALEARLNDLEEYLPSQYAALDYRGDATGLEELKNAALRLKSLAISLENELHKETPPCPTTSSTPH